MISFDTTQLPSRIATLLSFHGTDGPRLQWSQSRNPAAKATLEDIIEDTKLFSRKSLVNTGMASAVRAMLYLWNGFLSEAVSILRSVPSIEAAYIAGLCERHAGRPDQAKLCFQKVQTHPVHQALKSFTVSTINPGTDKVLDRFREIVEQSGVWDPFAFTDLFEHASNGRLSTPNERVVRILQCREFDFLFRHCFEAATGERITPKSTKTGGGKWRSNKGASQKNKPNRGTSRGGGSATKGERPVVVRCPKCEESSVLPPSLRGQRYKCRKCGSVFLIPGKPDPAPANPGVR